MKKRNSKNNPHSPYIKEREKLDGGFSKGFGFHFPPNEEYWVDAHCHLKDAETHAELYQALNEWFGKLDPYRLGRVIAIVKNDGPFKAYGDLKNQDERFEWIIWIHHDNPDPELLEKAYENGCVGVKLHNSPLMKGEGEPEVWRSDEWEIMFDLIEKKELPILWHVTQRMSASPYHGGGPKAYWSEGYEKGIDFNNEDLLNISLEIIERHPGIDLIGAHQLHVGLERLSDLFDKYENLYTDTSCGFYLRPFDHLYPEDKEILRNFFLDYEDRLLFGTDAPLAPGAAEDDYFVQGFLCHPRFISQLTLPHETLQKVAHKNAEKLFGLKERSISRRGSVRP